MGWIPISLYSPGSKKRWVRYLYPCIVQSIGKNGLDTYILVLLRALEIMAWMPISLYCSESREDWFGYLYPWLAQGLDKNGYLHPKRVRKGVFERLVGWGQKLDLNLWFEEEEIRWIAGGEPGKPLNLAAPTLVFSLRSFSRH